MDWCVSNCFYATRISAGVFLLFGPCYDYILLFLLHISSSCSHFYSSLHIQITPLFLFYIIYSFFLLLVAPTFLFSSTVSPSPCCEGDGAGSSGFPTGASAMCPSTGPRVDPHPVPVCSAGGLWHGLSGAEEVHPQGLGSQVGDSFSRCLKKKKKRSYFYKEGVFFTFSGMLIYLYYLSFSSTQNFTGHLPKSKMSH